MVNKSTPDKKMFVFETHGQYYPNSVSDSMRNSHYMSRDAADNSIFKLEFATRNAENARQVTLKLLLHYVTWRYFTSYSL